MNFIVSTETCADIVRHEMVEKNISHIFMKYILNDRAIEAAFNSDAEYASFYDKLHAGILPRTSQINPFEYTEYFTALLNEKKADIVHLSLSSGLSASCANAKLAADEINQTSPFKVHVIDSLTATQGLAYLVDEAVSLRDSGVSALEAVTVLEQSKLCIYHYIAVSDLFHLKRGGRISSASAAVGTLLQISPILVFDAQGKLKVINKAKGKGGVVKMFLRLMQKTVADSHVFYFAETDNYALSDLLATEVAATYPDCTIKHAHIGPVVGTHTGGGTIGIVFKGAQPRP